MYRKRKILALIPARGGSKTLLKKNIKILMGKPLIGWTIESAKQSKYIDKIIVSTDSEEIADISRDRGAEVPFLRPQELATDEAKTIDAAFHAIHYVESFGEKFDYLALLEPTSPLRKTGDIDHTIKMLTNDPEAGGVISVGKIHLEHPLIAKRKFGNFLSPYINNNSIGSIRRQELDEAYFPYGVIYLSDINFLKKEKTFYLSKTLYYEIERWQNYEVDDEIDWITVEAILKKYIKQVSLTGE